jgi:hypothetical protein
VPSSVKPGVMMLYYTYNIRIGYGFHNIWSQAFKQLAEYWPVEVSSKLYNTSDDVKVRFAGMLDLNATIRPDGSKNGYHVDLTSNIPLEIEGDKPGAYQMVFGSSGCMSNHNKN